MGIPLNKAYRMSLPLVSDGRVTQSLWQHHTEPLTERNKQRYQNRGKTVILLKIFLAEEWLSQPELWTLSFVLRFFSSYTVWRIITAQPCLFPGKGALTPRHKNSETEASSPY